MIFRQNNSYIIVRLRKQQYRNSGMLDKFMQNILTSNNTNTQKNIKENPKPPKDDIFSFPNLLKGNNNNKQVSKRFNTYLTISTWQTNSTKDMYDYESKNHVKVRDYKVTDAGCDIYMSQEQTSHGHQRCFVVGQGVYNANIFCGRVDLKNQFIYYLAGGQTESYRVVSDAIPEYLSVGNVIKIGRMKYTVKSTFNGKCLKEHRLQKQKFGNKPDTKYFKKCEGTCKFCLSEQTEDDILISPCKCKGSCAQVHISCLKQWLLNKVTRKSTQFVQFLNYDNFSCELCKEDIPVNFLVEGQLFSMLEEKSQLKQPFIVLQGIQNPKLSHNNNIQIKIKFKTEKKVVSIGRGHESQVKLQDVSISRKHCFLQLTNSGFELLDNKAKFGTLVQIESGSKIDMSRTRVQIGKMILETAQKQMKKNIENSKFW